LIRKVVEPLRNFCRERFALIFDEDIDDMFGASLVPMKLNDLNCNNNIESISFY
jgi:hypothetical protein